MITNTLLYLLSGISLLLLSFQTASDYSPRLIGEFRHEDIITSVDWSSDGQRILSGSEDGTAKLWDVNRGLITTLHHSTRVYAAVWNPDEQRILTLNSGDPSIKLWDTDGNLLANLKHDDSVDSRLKWSQDSTKILSSSLDKTIRLWTRTGQELVVFRHDAPVKKILWRADETKILSWTEDSSAYLWNIDGSLINQYQFDTSIYDAVWGDDENGVLLYSPTSVYIWHSMDNSVASFSHNATIGGAIWNRNADEIITWLFDGKAFLLNQTATILASFQHERMIFDADWNSNETMIVTCAGDATARIWDKNGHLLKTLPHGLLDDTGQPLEDTTLPYPDEVRSCQWSNDNQIILTTSNDAELCRGSKCVFSGWIWDAINGQLIAELPHDDYVEAIWSIDQNRILTWSLDGRVKIWSRTGELQVMIPPEDWSRPSVQSGVGKG